MATTKKLRRKRITNKRAKRSTVRYCATCHLFLGSRPVAVLDPETDEYFCTKRHLEIYHAAIRHNLDVSSVYELMYVSGCEFVVYTEGNGFILETKDLPVSKITFDGRKAQGPIKVQIDSGPHLLSTTAGERALFYIP